jgi:hypothetical protein
MQTCRRVIPAAVIGLLLVAYPAFVPASGADLFYDAEIKVIYEDNVVGLLAGGRGGPGGHGGAGGPMMGASMGPGGHSPKNTGSGPGSTSDTELNLFADLGGSAEIASRTSLFIAGSAEHTSYDSFTDLDSNIGRLSAGISTRLGDVLLAKFAVNGGIKRYRDSEQDSSAHGATVSLKERFTPAFWLKEVYDYEKNDADSAVFSYTGNSASVWAGFLIAPQATVLLGYTHLVRDFDLPVGFTLTANTVSVGLEYELVKKLYFDAQYDHQRSDGSIPDTEATDNIFSVGLRYSY